MIIHDYLNDTFILYNIFEVNKNHLLNLLHLIIN
jgi:hypothetical protein